MTSQIKGRLTEEEMKEEIDTYFEELNAKHISYDEFQNMDGLFIDNEKKIINKEFNVLDLLNNLSKEIQSLKSQVINK